MMSELISLETNADIFNSLDVLTCVMQLLILNRRVESSGLSSIRFILFEFGEDGYDDYRKEYNDSVIVSLRNKIPLKGEKYLTITTQTDQDHQAEEFLLITAERY